MRRQVAVLLLRRLLEVKQQLPRPSLQLRICLHGSAPRCLRAAAPAVAGARACSDCHFASGDGRRRMRNRRLDADWRVQLGPGMSHSGVVLALVLHIGIDRSRLRRTTSPTLATRLVCVTYGSCATGCAAAVHEAIAQPLRVGSLYVGLGACALAATVATQQPSLLGKWTSAPWDSLLTLDARRVDWHVGAHVALSALLVRGIFRGESSGRARSTAAVGMSKSKVITGTGSGWWGVVGVLLDTSQYSALHPLVIWHSRARAHRQCDTQYVLQLAAAGAATTSSVCPCRCCSCGGTRGTAREFNLFGGGLVRVEYSNSTHMSGYCPAETSAALSAGSVRLARQAGHSAASSTQRLRSTSGRARCLLGPTGPLSDTRCPRTSFGDSCETSAAVRRRWTKRLS